ncbi:hypothetical protein AB3U99_12145 [Niallia sp. JL1B1071]
MFRVFGFDIKFVVLNIPFSFEYELAIGRNRNIIQPSVLPKPPISS